MATFCVHGIALSDDCPDCRYGNGGSGPRHDPNNWAQDRRPILAALLPSDDASEVAAPFSADEGYAFQRFERNGEMASIPYLRCTKGDVSFEAPLVRFAWVSFDEAAS